MTDVLLVNPRSFFSIPSYLPNGLLYIASVLRENDIEVQIYDTNTSEEDFSEALKRLNPKIVGFSILSGPKHQGRGKQVDNRQKRLQRSDSGVGRHPHNHLSRACTERRLC